MDTDKSNIYSFSVDKSGYTDDKGTTYSTDYSVMRVIDGEAYLDWEYVASYTNCEYEYGDEPSRVNITKPLFYQLTFSHSCDCLSINFIKPMSWQI